jgi:hypothetical protein
MADWSADREGRGRKTEVRRQRPGKKTLIIISRLNLLEMPLRLLNQN